MKNLNINIFLIIAKIANFNILCRSIPLVMSKNLKLSNTLQSEEWDFGDEWLRVLHEQEFHLLHLK